MSLPLEIAANTFNATSVILAGRNSVHTWWTGIIGCSLFAVVFFGVKLYADVTLQIFFISTSVTGWIGWARGLRGRPMKVRHTRPKVIVGLAALGALVTAGYGALLHTLTDAAAPFLDSIVLAFSVLGQFLLVARRVESWWCWLLVNTVAVPLFFSRGLYVTAGLYAVFWINAAISLPHWYRLAGPRR